MLPVYVVLNRNCKVMPTFNYSKVLEKHKYAKHDYVLLACDSVLLQGKEMIIALLLHYYQF